MKCISIAALLVGALVWGSPAAHLPLRFIVCLAAILVAIQARRAGKAAWSTVLYVVIVLFNPFVAVMTLPLVLLLGTMVLFAASLRFLKTQPILSVPSITGRLPRSVSL